MLIHKCITSAPPNYLRPGDIFRRVIECIASGVFLPGWWAWSKMGVVTLIVQVTLGYGILVEEVMLLLV